MDGGVWERVSASFAQYSREDNCMQAYAKWLLSSRVQCHVYSPKEGSFGSKKGSFGSKKGSVPFKNSLARTLNDRAAYPCCTP